MKKIITTMTAVAICAVAPIIPAAPAMAQYTSVTCIAQSPFAIGQGINFTPDSACARALAECAIRSPAGSVCYVTRWWFN